MKISRRSFLGSVFPVVAVSSPFFRRLMGFLHRLGLGPLKRDPRRQPPVTPPRPESLSSSELTVPLSIPFEVGQALTDDDRLRRDRPHAVVK